MEAPAVLAYEEDIANRSLREWLVTHTISTQPLHRYKGIIKLKPVQLDFNGLDNKTHSDSHIIVLKHEIAGLYYGFDTVYSGFETRNMGLLWKPLRLKIKNEISETHLYMIINYRVGFCDNDKWFDLLTKWLAE